MDNATAMRRTQDRGAVGGRVKGTAATPWSWATVVKAATEVSSGQKLVWLEIRGLDRGAEHCYGGAAYLGRQIGLSSELIEKARRELVRCGLLGTASRPGKREASWWPTLPERCRPTSTRPSEEEVAELARRLDQHIRDRRGRGSTGVKDGGSVSAAGLAPQSTPVVAAVREEREVGGRGGSLPPPPQDGTSLPSSPPSSEGGAFAHERPEEGATPNRDHQPNREARTTPARRNDFRSGQPTPLANVISAGIAGVSPPVTAPEPAAPAPAEIERPEERADRFRSAWTSTLDPPHAERRDHSPAPEPTAPPAPEPPAPARAADPGDDLDDADLRTPREIERAGRWSKKKTTVAHASRVAE